MGFSAEIVLLVETEFTGLLDRYDLRSRVIQVCVAAAWWRRNLSQAPSILLLFDLNDAVHLLRGFCSDRHIKEESFRVAVILFASSDRSHVLNQEASLVNGISKLGLFMVNNVNVRDLDWLAYHIEGCLVLMKSQPGLVLTLLID